MPRHLLLIALTAAALFATGCTVNLSMKNDLPYPITVSATDEAHTDMLYGAATTRPQVTVAPGETVYLPAGHPDTGIAPFRQNDISFRLAPVGEPQSWRSCTFTFPDPSPQLRFRIAPTNDGSGALFIEAHDAIGIRQPQMDVKWDFTGNGWTPDGKNASRPAARSARAD